MSGEEFVSLWIGSESSPEHLEEMLEVTYSEDGDWQAPPFARAFQIEHFDEATREAEVLEAATKSVRSALAGFSYDDVITPAFEREVGAEFDLQATAVVLLYNFRYDGRRRASQVDGTTWQFVGAVRYR